MGPFGASHYSLNYFIPFYPKLPPPDDKVCPEVASVANVWKGLGLTYFLLKGLKRTSKTLKLMGDTAEGYSKKGVPGPGTGMNGTSRIDKGACQNLTAKNLAITRPVKSPSSVGYGLGRISQNYDQLSCHTRACKVDTLGVFCKEQNDMLVDFLEGFSERSLYEAAMSSSADLRCSTAKSFKGLGLRLEGVMTTIVGHSQQADYKKEIFTVVKTTDRVMEGVKAATGIIRIFASPLGDVLHIVGAGGNGVTLGLNAVKIVLKSVKISKGLITVTKLFRNAELGAFGAGAEIAIKVERNIFGQRFKAIVKGLKASEGAANIVKITKEVGKTLGMLDKVEILSWSVAMKGFKFTKSAVRILEPLGSLPLGVISVLREGILEVKGVVEGVGIAVKAVVILRELHTVLLKGIGFAKGAMAAFNRRLLLSKPFLEPLAGISNAGSEETYSQRMEVKLCYVQQLSMPIIIWPSTKAERKQLRNGRKSINYSCSSKEVGVFSRAQELLENGEGNHCNHTWIQAQMTWRSLSTKGSMPHLTKHGLSQVHKE